MRGEAPAGGDSARQSMALEISNGLVQLMSRYTGRGPTKARTAIGAGYVLSVFHDTLTKAEQNLVAAGNTAAVDFMRANFEELMHDEAVQLVEGLTGRQVLSFLSDVHAQANVAIHVFLFESSGGNGVDRGPRPEARE